MTDATFVYDWPASQAALAKIECKSSFRVAKRFEAYLGGVELGNAFQEVNDSLVQHRRCEQQNTIRQQMKKPPHPIDTELVRAVERIPTTAGIAIGFERLVAILSGWHRLA